ncbi:MAG: transporter substrate-binding domain-containing protein [Cytophagales bacterium]|nr:transporter substrate-binding domain-containing protein [Cytophagales bacterium]
MKLFFNLLLFGVAFLALGCDSFPKDPRHTLDQVRNGTLRVGYSENRPWVTKSGNAPGGTEAELVRQFAQSLHAKIEWHNDTEQNLFERLEKNEIHLVIAGFTDETPWKETIGMTRPYVKAGKKKHVMAVVPGENGFLVALETFLQQHPLNSPPGS